MAVDGLWKMEVYGEFGWESRGIFVLENGRAICGGDRHYCVGSYTLLPDDNIRIGHVTHYFGPPRKIFGEERADFEVMIEGEIEGDTIMGVMSRPDRPQFSLEARLSRLSELP